MTFTDERPGPTPGTATQPLAATPAAISNSAATPAAARATGSQRSPWEQCDSCQSPVDDQQRYCVACGAHQRRPSDPVIRYFAAARKPKFATPPTPSSEKRTVSTSVAAMLIALLPVAAGVGILVGRGSADASEQVIEALKAAKVTQGVAAAGATGAVTAEDAAAEGDSGGAAGDKTKEKVEVVDGVQTSDKQAPIIASGPTGTARKLEGTKPTKKDLAESRKAVDQINRRKGAEYIETQRDLPDVIVIP